MDAIAACLEDTDEGCAHEARAAGDEDGWFQAVLLLEGGDVTPLRTKSREEPKTAQCVPGQRCVFCASRATASGSGLGRRQRGVGFIVDGADYLEVHRRCGRDLHSLAMTSHDMVERLLGAPMPSCDGAAWAVAGHCRVDHACHKSRGSGWSRRNQTRMGVSPSWRSVCRVPQ